MDSTANLETNQPISLGKLEVAFVIDGRRVEVPGEAFQNFSPDPHVTVQVQDVPRSSFSPAEPIAQYGIVSELRDGQILRAPLVTEGPASIELGYGTTIDVVSDLWLSSEDGHAFRPAHSPCVVLDANEFIARVQFTVLNFVPKGSRLRRRLESQPWVVNISPVENLSDLERVLAETGGYGVTHWGSLERTDGATFTSAEVADLLLGLDHFLSFVSGAHCSINTATGYADNGTEVWKRWGSFHVSRWRRHRSWDDVTIASALPELFDAFWSEFPASKNGLGRIIRLYAESNNTSNLDVSVILAQTALEAAAHLWFGKRRKRSTKEWIAAALKCAKIPVRIPDRLNELRDLGHREGWQHGPECLVKFRNPAIHAKAGGIGANRDAYHEARQLALWYLELMVLRRLKYQGEYACRLEPVQRAGATELVPWPQIESRD